MRVVDALFEATKIRNGSKIIADIQHNIFEDNVRFIEADLLGTSMTISYCGELLDTAAEKIIDIKIRICPLFGLEEIALSMNHYDSHLKITEIKDYLKEKLLTKYEF